MAVDDVHLELLLAHADDHRPALGEGVPITDAGEAVKPDELLGDNLRDFDKDPADLAAQRWGVIAPEGKLGDELLAAIDPLVKARCEAQQGRKVQIYRVKPGMTAREVMKWRKNVYPQRRDEDTPRYLLILGDLDQVSLEMQQYIAIEAHIGRLALSSVQDYASYAAKVLRWERSPPDQAPRAVFYTVRDGTNATTIGYNALMRPTVREARARQAEGSFPASDITEIQRDDIESNEDLLQALPQQPSMVFSISHGLGAPRRGWSSTDTQRALQGALCLGRGEHLSAADVQRGPFLPGSIWFFLACYSAGTPSESAYSDWLSQLRQAGKFEGRLDAVVAGLPKAGEPPFIAALPTAALANPDGPCAIIGHVDLAWTYSFQDLDETVRNRPERFEGIFRSLVTGARAGMAHVRLLRLMGEAQTELVTMLGDETRAQGRGQPVPRDAAHVAEKANLWMLRQDLLGYIALGDPAVRIPGAAQAKAAPARTGAQLKQDFLRSLQGGAPPPDISTRAAAPTGGVPQDKMEQAVIACLSEEKTSAKLAAALGVDKADVERWVRAYQEAGRAALAKLR